MFKESFFKTLAHRCATALSGWWCDLRFYWYTRNKTNWIFFSVLGLVVAALGFAMHAIIMEHHHNRNLTCLALNVYYEARSEPEAGQYAVAEVTMNRVASKLYPNTICEVVYQQNWDRIRGRYVGAFSWTELDEIPKLENGEWLRAWRAAEAVYYKERDPKLKGALFYHASYIKPSWAKRKKPVARIGNHIFYR